MKLKNKISIVNAIFLFVMVSFFITAFSPSKKLVSHETPEKEKIVNEWYRVWDEGDVSGFSKIMHKDVKDHDKNPQMPGSDYDGLVGISQAVTVGFSDVKHNLVDVYYLPNNRIATRWEFVGKHTGNFFGVPATNKMVYFSGQDILQLKDGKIAEIWHIEELLQCMAQINPQN